MLSYWSLTHGIPARAAMITEFHKLGHGDTIRNAANLLLATSQQDFPVTHGDQVVGNAQPQPLLVRAGCRRHRRFVAAVLPRLHGLVFSSDLRSSASSSGGRLRAW